MTEKKITAVVGTDGKIAMSFKGFRGKSCYDEAREIRVRLSELGIDVCCDYQEDATEQEQTTVESQNDIQRT